MVKVMESKDYGMFKLSDFNRGVRRNKALEESMRQHGWIDAYPMHVQQNGGRQYIIKAGHHRFDIAMKLGIPVKYVVSDDTATIHELERSGDPWKMKDYLSSYCLQGRQDYLIVRRFCEETGICLQNAISMLGGESANSHNYSNSFKDGTFVIKGMRHANTVKDIVLYLKHCGIPFAASSLFVQAISKVVFVPTFDVNHFKQKIKAFAAFIEKKATVEQYLDMIEELYNRQSRSKIPLKFLTNEEAKKRSPIKR